MSCCQWSGIMVLSVVPAKDAIHDRGWMRGWVQEGVVGDDRRHPSWPMVESHSHPPRRASAAFLTEPRKNIMTMIYRTGALDSNHNTEQHANTRQYSPLLRFDTISTTPQSIRDASNLHEPHAVILFRDHRGAAMLHMGGRQARLAARSESNIIVTAISGRLYVWP